mgnify:FL=1
MAFWTLGINHTTAPLDIRGRLAFDLNQIGPALIGFREKLEFEPEAALLSTCNRTEIYCACEHLQIDSTLLWMAEQGKIDPAQLRAHAYILENEAVAQHAFRVASGLDSMVLGEPQILGQLKNAINVAHSAGTLGTNLSQLFQRSFAVAKEVRSTTEIGAQSISMAAAAVRLAGQLFEDLCQLNILFVGAGEMIELCATHFASKNPKSMTIANRTIQRGENLASLFNARVMHLSDLPDHLHEFDVVISCTASTLPIIGLGAVERALRNRRRRPIFMVDLAVPRDIELEIKHLDDVYLYTIDDLASVVQIGQASRQAAVAKAEVIVCAGVDNFKQWIDQRQNVPLIQELQGKTEVWRQIELQRARKLLQRGDDIELVLEALSRGLTQKILHGLISELRSNDPHIRDKAGQAINQFFLSKDH